MEYQQGGQEFCLCCAGANALFAAGDVDAVPEGKAAPSSLSVPIAEAPSLLSAGQAGLVPPHQCANGGKPVEYQQGAKEFCPLRRSPPSCVLCHRRFARLLASIAMVSSLAWIIRKRNRKKRNRKKRNRNEKDSGATARHTGKKQNKNGVGKKNHQTENQNYQARGSLNLTR